MPSLLDIPVDAPAHQAWLELWKAGFNVQHPQPNQTAGDWLASLNLTQAQLEKIYQTMPPEGKTA